MFSKSAPKSNGHSTHRRVLKVSLRNLNLLSFCTETMFLFLIVYNWSSLAGEVTRPYILQYIIKTIVNLGKARQMTVARDVTFKKKLTC